MSMWQNFKRNSRRRLVVLGVNYCVSVSVKLILWEKLMAKQDDCKHPGAEGKTYCPECGKQLVDPETEETKGMIKKAVAEALAEAGIKPPAAPSEKKVRKSLAERLGKGK